MIRGCSLWFLHVPAQGSNSRPLYAKAGFLRQSRLSIQAIPGYSKGKLYLLLVAISFHGIKYVLIGHRRCTVSRHMMTK